MMKVKLPLTKALPLAQKIKAELAPACERVEIAGSIRRNKSIVGDIEIVAIPKLRPDLGAQLSLLGDDPRMVSALDLLLDKLVEEKSNFRRGDKNGPLFKNFLITIDNEGDEIALDLFITTPPQWGYILALRTAPGAFNRVWVTPKSKGGLLSDEYHFAGGWLRGPDGAKIPTPHEVEFFLEIIGGYLPPEKRDEWHKYFNPLVGF